MSQRPRPAKQPQDAYAARGKTLTSAVQRLRGWVGTDPARAPELADALVELTAHRLLGHAYAAAAADAQESVRRAAELLTAPGPIGPYTSVTDAARYVTAVVHAAALQAGIGQAEAAGRTLESLEPLHLQLRELGLDLPLEPPTAVWALAASARAALAGGDVAGANSYADAAAVRLAGAGRDDDTELGYLALDVDRLVADCRWAAGRPSESLALLHRARVTYDALVDGRLATPGRLSPALLERLAEPLAGLYGDLADRLVATGETDTGLDVRRALIELLRGLGTRLGDRTRRQLASSLADLAADLAAAGRQEEADAAAAESASLVPTATAEPLVSDRSRGVADGEETPVSWSPLPDDNPYASAVRAAAATVVPAPEDEAWLEADRAEARRREAERREQAQRAAERAAAEQRAAEQAAAAERAAEQARAAEDRAREAERQAAAEEAERVERKRRRQERLREHRREELEREIDRLTAAADAGDPTAAPEREQRRAELAELDSDASTEPERPEPERPEPERPEPEHPAPVAAARVEPVEPVEPDPAAPAPAPDELDLAQEAWTQARARGDRRAARSANERVVELLRARVEAEPDAYTGRLVEALEALASARLRSGDVFGSRSAAREARTLARRPGR